MTLCIKNINLQKQRLFKIKQSFFFTHFLISLGLLEIKYNSVLFCSFLRASLKPNMISQEVSITLKSNGFLSCIWELKVYFPDLSLVSSFSIMEV